MEPLRIKDNSPYQKDVFSGIKTLTSQIANKTLQQLEGEGVFVFPALVREAEDITGEQVILQEADNTYRSGNVMGFLGCGEERLVIQSRFSGEKDFFFQYLLSQVLELPNVVRLDTNADTDSQRLDFFLFLFPYYLRAAMRKGLFKQYIRRSYNDGRVKGTIEIARHIRENTPFVGNIAYSQREFSYDNSLLELVRHTIEFIRQKSYGNRLLAKVKEEVRLVVEATPGYALHDRAGVIDGNKKNPIRHAYFREYLVLQRLCLLILRHRKHQIGSGAQRIHGILFDGAWLWEEYVNLLIGERFYHPRNREKQGAERLFHDNIGTIYPDFISRSDTPRILADAKYKPIENIGNRDYLQVLAYMFRFDAEVGYYLYPEAAGAADKTLYLNRGLAHEKNVTRRNDVYVRKHGLTIPAEPQDYDVFVSRMEESEREFVKIFSTN